MPSLIALLSATLSMVLLSSCQGTIVICVVLLLQRVLQTWLTPRCQYLIWGIVIVRLALPVFPESDFSIMNWVPERLNTQSRPADKLSTPFTSEEAVATIQVVDHAPLDAGLLPDHPDSVKDINRNSTSPAAFSSAGGFRLLLRFVAGVVWICGVVIGCLRLGNAWRHGRRLIAEAMPANDRLLRIAETCRQTIKAGRSARILLTDRRISPSVSGIVRPVILLPERIVRELSDEELRHVLLHEFAHIRRNDVAVQWLCECLRIVHWFNPVVWFALRKLRLDREMACDALVLTECSEASPSAYGRTAIRSMELVSSAGYAPVAVGLLNHKPAMMRRVAMIGRFQRPTRFRVVSSALVLCLLALIGLTNATSAQEQKTQQDNGEKHKDQQTAIEVDSPESVPFEITLEGFHVYDGNRKPDDVGEEIREVTDDALPEKLQKKDTLRLVLRGDSDGHLVSIQIGDDLLPAGADIFEELSSWMEKWAKAKDRGPVEDRELQIRADYDLHYEIISKAITACAGQNDRTTDKVVRYVNSIRFAAPVQTVNLDVKVGYMRAADGQRVADNVVLMIGRRAATMETVEEALRNWLKEESIDPEKVVLRIQCDPDAQASTVQQLIAVARPVGFSRVALHVLKASTGDQRDLTTVYQLERIDAEAAVQALQQLFGDNVSQIDVDRRTNSVIVRGTPQIQATIQRVLRKLDAAPQDDQGNGQTLRTFSTGQLDPQSVAKTLKMFFQDTLNGGLKIEADSGSARILVRADEETLELIEQLLRQLGDGAKPKKTESAEPAKPADEKRQSSLDIRIRESQSLVFVLDRSASMAHQGNLQRAGQQLKKFLRRLTPAQRFQIVFGNEHATLMKINGESERMYAGTATNQAQAMREIDRIQPQGGTNRRQSIVTAAGLKPQLIVLLTDNEEPEVLLSELKAVLPAKTSLQIMDVSRVQVSGHHFAAPVVATDVDGRFSFYVSLHR